MSIWDDPTIRTTGDFVKFETVGDTLVADIIALGVHEFPDGKRCAKLTLVTDDGEEKVLTAGQVQLANRLVELRPEVGDRIRIVFTDVEKRQGGKTLKHFSVDVDKGGAKAAPPAPTGTDSEPW